MERCVGRFVGRWVGRKKGAWWVGCCCDCLLIDGMFGFSLAVADAIVSAVSFI